VHIFNDVKFTQPLVSDLLFEQPARHNPHHMSAMRQAGIGNGAHQANLTATVDKRNVSRREDFTHIARCFDIQRILPGR
jgi:hypothetical protein